MGEIKARALSGCAALLLMSSILVSAQSPSPAPAANAAGGDPEAQNILEKAEQIRFPTEGFEVQIAVTTTNQGQVTDARKYRVMSKGNSKTVALLTEPATDRGQILLMNGRDFWVYLPNVSQPVRLPLSQKLSGQVANGDIARANFTGDYTAKLLRTEKTDGGDYYVLELNAVDRAVTYHRVIYWVKQSNFYPYKAEFYTVSGNLIKTCTFEQFQQTAGKTRPTRLVLVDALRKGEQSILDYSNMIVKDIPDRTFSKDFLRRIE
jgi:outer membrane lipoprotein-sorting protein